MPRLSHAQLAAQHQIRDASGTGLAPERLGERIMRAIGTAIPMDGYRLFGVDPATRLVNRVLAASDNDGWARIEYLQTVYLAFGPGVYSEFSNVIAAGIPAAAFQERQSESWGYPEHLLATMSPDEHYRLFHEMSSPIGGGIQGIFRSNGQVVAAMQMYRREARQPFRATDVAFLKLVEPVIGAAIGAALARERALQRKPAAPGAPSGVVIVSETGSVQLATPDGERLVDTLFAVEGAVDGALPTAIWSSIARLRASDGARVGSLTIDTPSGVLRVEATPVGGEQSGDVSIVLTPVQPPVLPDTPPSWALTRQEREVVRLVLRGAGNQAISNALSIGEHTVETHLTHVYDKLDVRGRGELLARFFQETFYPDLEREGSG